MRRHNLKNVIFQITGWCTFCFGDEFWAKLKTAEDPDSKTPIKRDKSFAKNGHGSEPLLEIFCELKQFMIARLIEWHAEWAETLDQVDSQQAVWFYALMSAVEKPLHPDVQSSLRSFVLICSKQRNALKKSTPYLNLMICLVSRYFGQADLADEY